MLNLTIVLTLYDRGDYYNYPKRWIKFANKHLNEFKIIVADGSGKKEIEKFFIKKSNFKDLNLKYLKYSKDKNYHDYFAKLSDSINKVKTKYTVLADDDDFYSYKGLKKSIEFLENNKDYVTCRGIIGTFKIRNKSILNNFYIPKKQLNLSQETASDRFKGTIQQNINPIFYDVHHSKFQKRNFKLLNQANFIEPAMVEMLPQFLDSKDGKIGRINELYLMRQVGENNSAHAQYVEKKGGIIERLTFGDFNHDLKIWAKIIAKEISKKDKKNFNSCYNFITQTYNEGLKKNLQSIINNKKTKSSTRIKNIVKQNLLFKIIFSKMINQNNTKKNQIIINENKFLNQIDNHLKYFK